MPCQRDQSRPGDLWFQRDPPDPRRWKKHQVRRLDPRDLSHPFALVGPVVRGSRHWNGMTTLTLVRDSWKRFPCCRRTPPLTAPAVRRIIRTLDSIVDLAATSEP